MRDSVMGGFGVMVGCVYCLVVGFNSRNMSKRANLLILVLIRSWMMSFGVWVAWDLSNWGLDVSQRVIVSCIKFLRGCNSFYSLVDLG